MRSCSILGEKKLFNKITFLVSKGFSCCWLRRPPWTLSWFLLHDTLGRSHLGELTFWGWCTVTENLTCFPIWTFSFFRCAKAGTAWERYAAGAKNWEQIVRSLYNLLHHRVLFGYDRKDNVSCDFLTSKCRPTLSPDKCVDRNIGLSPHVWPSRHVTSSRRRPEIWKSGESWI